MLAALRGLGMVDAMRRSAMRERERLGDYGRCRLPWRSGGQCDLRAFCLAPMLGQTYSADRDRFLAASLPTFVLPFLGCGFQMRRPNASANLAFASPPKVLPPRLLGSDAPAAPGGAAGTSGRCRRQPGQEAVRGQLKERPRRTGTHGGGACAEPGEHPTRAGLLAVFA